MSWLVYVLVSESSTRTYVGIALDLERRLAQHNGALRGGARSTRAGRPWALGASHGPYPSRAAAQVTEARLKRERGPARLAWVDAAAPPQEQAIVESSPQRVRRESSVRIDETSPARRQTRGGSP